MKRLFLAIFLSALAAAQTVTLPGFTNPNVSTSWLYYNKMRWAGAWSSVTTYNPQDVVSYGGYGYVSLAGSNLNHTPSPGGTSYWTQLPTSAFTLPSGTQTQYLQIQPNTGNNSTYRFTSPTTLTSTDFDFPAQTPGNLLIAGGVNQSVTLTPCPIGVNGSDTLHYVYLSGGTGTAEAVLITGGTCTSGATSGTITFTPANNHSGAWTVSSAASGIPEALNSSATPHVVTVPAGTYTLYGPVYVRGGWAVVGQGTGDGLPTTKFNVATTFPLTGLGVFVGDGTVDQKFSDFQIAFTQPDEAVITNYIHWPPAFYLVANPAFYIDNVHVERAWDVIRMTGNSGGAHIKNLQASHFNVGIDIDGAWDSIYLDTIRFWVYGLTDNQKLVFQGTESIIGLKSARADDLQVINFFGQCRKSIYIYQSASGGTAVGNFTHVTTDSGGRVVISNGYIQMSNVWMSQSVGTRSALEISGSDTKVKITNAYFFPGPTSAGILPLISVTDGTFQLTNSWFWTFTFDVSSIIQSGGQMILSSNVFTRSASIAFANPTVSVTGGRATIIGNRTIDKGSGAGTFISVALDDYHQIRGNTFVGWSSSYPASKQNGWYEDDLSANIPAVLLRPTWLVGLGTPADGTIGYCANCMVTSIYDNTCIAGGSGAFAARINGVWRCFNTQNYEFSNYITSETGANNAIAGALVSSYGAPVPISAGLRVIVKLAHTLQAGSNTFNYNGGGALAIKSSRNSANNIAVAYAATGIVELIYDGTQWLDVSQ